MNRGRSRNVERRKIAVDGGHQRNVLGRRTEVKAVGARVLLKGVERLKVKKILVVARFQKHRLVDQRQVDTPLPYRIKQNIGGTALERNQLLRRHERPQRQRISTAIPS